MGYALGDRGTWLPYVTGGLAYGESKINGTQTLPAPVTAFSMSNTRVGWTVGAGVEWAFAPQWSAKAEYLYVALPTTTLILVDSVKFNTSLVRAGLNWKF